MDAAIPEVLTEEQLSARLREAGFRVTRPRLAVYRVLADLGGHVSVDAVLAELGRREIRLSRMTAYNVMADLERARLVMRADAGPGRALYEAAGHWHHHFVCRRCGEVFDVPCVVGEKPCLDPSLAPGTVDEAQVIFRGICDACLSGRGRAADGHS